jgi:hypothetical protein
MVPSSALTIFTDGEHLACGHFSRGETVCFTSLEFITHCFGGLSLSPRGSDSDAALMGSTSGGPPSLLRAMIEDSTEEFHTVSSREEGSPPPLSLKAQHRGSVYYRHNRPMARGRPILSGYDDGPTVGTRATTEHQPPI